MNIPNSLAFDGESHFHLLSFLNRVNGGAGSLAVNTAIALGALLYATPYYLSRLFPEQDDSYPLSNQRVSIGISFRNRLRENPQTQRFIYLVTDTAPIASALSIIFFRQLAQPSAIYLVTYFPTVCLFVLFSRVIVHQVALCVHHYGTPRIASIANRIGEFVRPNLTLQFRLNY